MGGLKLKLISFVILAILTTVTVQNLFTLPLIKDYIEKKAFEVSTTTIERISDFSSFSLLERTYENRLSLNDSIKKIQNSSIDGLIAVSIYQRQKYKENIHFNYLAGFGIDNKETTLDSDLIKYLENSINDDVTYESSQINLNNKTVDVYRFVKPIIYKYKNETILLGTVLLYYNKDSINLIVEKMINLIFIITIVILLLATLIVYFTVIRFIQPILLITKAATDVSKGDLDINLDVKTNDEVQQLAEQFNIMVNGLQEKEKMQKFVSDSTINMIQQGSKCKLLLGGEYRTLTFLFCDIRGFTAMSEEKEPSEVVAIINFYLNLQSEIIKANGGDIDKFIGDEIMASFSGEGSTDKAIKSAIEIQKMIQIENIKRKSQNKTICNIGIGINKGSVIVGNIGSDERMDFTSIGLPVNIASRLCSSAKADEIIIEKNSFYDSKNDYNVKELEPIIAKGISYPVHTYSIIYLEES